MSILRTLVLAGTIGLSTMVIGFVAADRLVAQGGVPATRLAAAAPEPQTTGAVVPTLPGTVTQGAEAPAAKPARPMSGFDTERLNALMRGEMPPPPEPAPAPARIKRR